jgi:hypothetical protein
MGSPGWISATQFERDHNGQRNICAACGHNGSKANPLVVDEDGSRIHTSHTTDQNSGYYQSTDDTDAM